MPNLSYYEVPPYSHLCNQSFTKGTFYGSRFGSITIDSSINIHRDDWSLVVNTLRHFRACFTGKRHEAYAACIARCPFVTPIISTHKISALGFFLGEDLPTIEDEANQGQVLDVLRLAEKDPNGLFERLFDKLEDLRRSISLKDYLGLFR
jgi:hypothetical protein